MSSKKKNNLCLKIEHTNLFLKVDLDKCSIKIISEIKILLSPPYSNIISFNLKKQCHVVSANIIDIDGQLYQAEYIHQDPFSPLISDPNIRSLRYYESCFESAVDYQTIQGELQITIPEIIIQKYSKFDSFHLTIILSYFLQDHFDYWTYVSSPPLLFTHCDYSDASLWIPCNEMDSVHCTFSLFITVQHNITVIATGNEVSVERNELSQTYHYEINYPIRPNQIGICIGHLSCQYFPLDDQRPFFLRFFSPQSFQSLYYPSHLIIECFKLFEDFFETCYPFSNYNHVFINETMFDSIVFPGLVICTLSSLYPENFFPLQTYFSQHIGLEIAQSWIKLLKIRNYNSLWVQQGLSCWLNSYWIKHHEGLNEYRANRFNLCQKVVQINHLFFILVPKTKGQKHEEKLQPVRLSLQKNSTDIHDFEGDSYIPIIPPLSWRGYLHYVDIVTDLWKAKSELVMLMLEEEVKRHSIEPETCFNSFIRSVVSVHMSQSASIPLKYTTFIDMARSHAGAHDFDVFIKNWIHDSRVAFFKIQLSQNDRLKHTASLLVWKEEKEKKVIPLRQNIIIYIQQHNGQSLEFTRPLIQTNQELPENMNFVYNKLRKVKLTKEQIRFRELYYKQQNEVLIHPEKWSEIQLEDVITIPKFILTNFDWGLSWIHFDPHYSWIRDISMDVPIIFCYNILHHSYDVSLQLQAAETLRHYDDIIKCRILLHFLMNNQTYWRIRIACAASLARDTVSSTRHFSHFLIISYFKKQFFYSDGIHVKPNQFFEISQYHLQCEIPTLLSCIRENEYTPPDIIQIILCLLEDNDNSNNRYNDDFYISSILLSLKNIHFPQDDIVTRNRIFSQIQRYLKLDILFPSHGNLVSQTCLFSYSYISLIYNPSDTYNVNLILYTQSSFFQSIRIAAFKSMVILMSHFKDNNTLYTKYRDALLLILSKPSTLMGIKYAIVNNWYDVFNQTIDLSHVVDDSFLMNSLWELLLKSQEPMLRRRYFQLFQCIWGIDIPKCATLVQRKAYTPASTFSNQHSLRRKATKEFVDRQTSKIHKKLEPLRLTIPTINNSKKRSLSSLKN